MSQYRFIATGNFVDFYDQDMHVIKLQNTSRCVTWLFDNTPGLNFKIDEMIYHTDTVSDISFDDVDCATQEDFVTGITTMFPDLAGEAGGTTIYSGDGTINGDRLVNMGAGATLDFQQNDVTRFGIFGSNTSMKSPDGSTSLRIDNGTIQAEGLSTAANMTNKKVVVWDETSAEFQVIPANELGI